MFMCLYLEEILSLFRVADKGPNEAQETGLRFLHVFINHL